MEYRQAVNSKKGLIMYVREKKDKVFKGESD